MKIEAPNGDVPEEHREAYGEMCRQFSIAVLGVYEDMSRVTIMRELPTALRLNAVLVGTMTGSLAPLLMRTKRGSDFEIAALMAKQMPQLVAAARRLAEETLREAGRL